LEGELKGEDKFSIANFQLFIEKLLLQRRTRRNSYCIKVMYTVIERMDKKIRLTGADEADGYTIAPYKDKPTMS